MDSVASGTRREILHNKVGAAQAVLRRAAAAALLQNDPLSEQLNAVATSIGALADIYEASEDTLLEITGTLKAPGVTVSKEAIAQIQAAASSMIGGLAPRLTGLVEKTVQDRTKTVRLRTLLGFSLSMLAVVFFAGCISYGVGFSAGRIQGELTGHRIDGAMAAGPDAAATWAVLMADNNPVAAMAACRKAVSSDAQSRRYCAMPVWLDPVRAPSL